MQESPKYYDSFMYAGEFEALRIRLHELDDLVEKFIIVESIETFRGNDKPLFLNDVWGEIEPWHHKIQRVILDKWENATDAWSREKYQRDMQRHGVVISGAKDEDIIIAGDVDEIPKASVVRKINPWGGCVHLDMNTYYFKINWKVPDRWNQGGRPFVSTLAQLGSVHETRNNQKKIAIDAGWHFSYLGTVEDIVNKIKSFSHSEYDLSEYTDPAHIEKCIRDGLDPFGRFELEPVELGFHYPFWVMQNRDILTHLLRDRGDDERGILG